MPTCAAALIAKNSNTAMKWLSCYSERRPEGAPWGKTRKLAAILVAVLSATADRVMRFYARLGVTFPSPHMTVGAAPAQYPVLNPESLGKPIAPYSNITRVKASEFLFIAGQVGMDESGKTPADFDGQCAQEFANIGAALASQGAGFPNIVEFTSYLVHSQDIGKFVQYRAREYPRLFPGGGYPTNTLLIVDRLVREEFLIEVSAVAAL